MVLQCIYISQEEKYILIYAHLNKYIFIEDFLSYRSKK